MFEDRPEDQEAPRIKVTDRRLFDRDGNPREPDKAEDPPAPLPPLTPPAAAPAKPEPSRPAAPAAGKPQAGQPQAGQTAAPLQVSADALLHYLEEQYMMSMIALGAMPHPQTGQPAEDLDMAQLRIEMLDALRERTEGHRPPEASQALDEILYRLRMTYLQKRKVVKI